MEDLYKQSTEELEQILRDDFYNKPHSPEQVQKVLQILEEREASDINVDEAWQEQQCYFKNKNSSQGKPTSILTNSFKRLAVVAALFFLIITVIPSITGAGSFSSLWGRWTDNIFWFERQSNIVDRTPNNSLEYHTENADLLRMYNTVCNFCDTPVVPAWIPEGYEIKSWDDFLNASMLSETYEAHEIAAEFTRGEDTLIIRIYIGEEPPNTVYGKDEKAISIYNKNGIEHHIMSYNEKLVCIWYFDGYGGSISGNLSMEELYRIIDSIYG